MLTSSIECRPFVSLLPFCVCVYVCVCVCVCVRARECVYVFVCVYVGRGSDGGKRRAMSTLDRAFWRHGNQNWKQWRWSRACQYGGCVDGGGAGSGCAFPPSHSLPPKQLSPRVAVSLQLSTSRAWFYGNGWASLGCLVLFFFFFFTRSTCFQESRRALFGSESKGAGRWRFDDVPCHNCQHPRRLRIALVLNKLPCV